VYINLRNILPKSGTFPPGHCVYDLRNPSGDMQIGKCVALCHVVTQWKVQKVDSRFIVHVQKF